MYLVRRIVTAHPGKVWEVAGYLSKICQAYEEGTSRNKAQIFIGGMGIPGTSNVVYAEWTQDRIEPTDYKKVPPAVGVNHSKMAPLMTDNQIEFYEVVTPEKLKMRGLA